MRYKKHFVIFSWLLAGAFLISFFTHYIYSVKNVSSLYLLDAKSNVVESDIGQVVSVNVPKVANDRVIVKYVSSSAKAKALSAVKNKQIAGISVATVVQDPLLDKLGNYQVYTVKDNVEDFVKQMKKVAGVVSVQQVPIATISASGDWTSYNNSGQLGDYPLDFENPTAPLTGRHWYLEKARFPIYWHKLGCVNDSPNCLADSSIIIAVIDTGFATSGTTSSPVQADFSYTNICDDEDNSGDYSADECLIPVAEEGDLDFRTTSIKDSNVADSHLWNNPNESSTAPCNDTHGVDIEIFEYNNDNGIASNCSLDQRQKEGITADDYGHGTFVTNVIMASVLDASNSPIGVASNFKVMTIKANIPFTGTFYIDRLASGIVYAVDNGAKVINMSVSTGFDVNILRDAIEYARDHDVAIVAASGNAGQDSLEYPASYATDYDNVFAVGALNKNGNIAGYSNFLAGNTFLAYVGDGATDVTNTIKTSTISCNMQVNDCAPVKDTNDGVYKKDNSSFVDSTHIGTSFAAPQVAGAVANILQYEPSFDIPRVKKMLEQEYASPSTSDMVLDMYKLYTLPYFSDTKQWSVAYDLDSIKYADTVFVDNTSLIRVHTGTDSNNSYAWWTRDNLRYGLYSTRDTLMADFGNEQTDKFFYEHVVGDNQKDAIVARQVATNSGFTLTVYVAEQVSTSSGHVLSNPSVWYTEDLTDQNRIFVADVNGDGRADLIRAQYNGTSSTYDIYVALGGTDKFNDGSSSVLWASGIDAQTVENSMFFADVTGDDSADLIFNKQVDELTVEWYVAVSGGTAFGTATKWADDVGDSGDFYYLKDITGDGQADIVVSSVGSDTVVSWNVAKSTGSAFDNETEWEHDFGNKADYFVVGDINNDNKADIVVLRPRREFQTYQKMSYFVAYSTGTALDTSNIKTGQMTDFSDNILAGDFNGDGKQDLAFGRILSKYKVAWYVAISTGTYFEQPQLWYDDFGNLGDIWYVADFDGDGKDDLALKRSVDSSTQAWYVVKSTGGAFTSTALWDNDFGDNSAHDRWYIADFNGDNKADLALARQINVGTVRWYVELSDGNRFLSHSVWQSDFGNDFSNEQFFAGDFTGDGKADVALVRLVNSTTATWYVQKSSGSSFSYNGVWYNDFGNAGDSWIVGDFFNHDRLDVFIRRVDNGSNSIKSYLTKSTGGSFDKYIEPGGSFGSTQTYWYSGDFDGDGYAEFAIVEPGQTLTHISVALNHKSQN